MPIQKVEKTFKFGILSTSYRVSLQERLLRDFQDQQRLRLEAVSAKESPCRVKSAFVRSFNQEANEVPRLQFKKKAYTLLERIKRLVGIVTNGEGQYIDTPLAWRECVQLAQCEDRDIINASLDILWVSLEQTPISDALVPVCFDVAEIILYWIANRTSRQQAISETELRMLHIGRLIFLRLYFYHMTCKISLEKHSEFRLRLAYQLNGFENIVPIYQNYPDTWLCARIIDHVGRMITEGMSLTFTNTELAELDEVNSTDAKIDKNRAAMILDEPIPVTKAITEGVHALSPSLWHALDIFKAVESKYFSDSQDLDHALRGLIECDIMTKSENWLDCACALMILGDAMHRDLNVLRTVERLFASNQESRKLWHKWTESRCGYDSSRSSHGPRAEILIQNLPAELVVTYASILVDTCLRSHDINIQRFALIGYRYKPDPLEKTECPTVSLADLFVIQMPDQANEWRVRYVATLGLLLIRRCFANDSLRNGVSLAADALLKSGPVQGTSEYCRGQPAPVQQPGTVDWFAAANLTSPWHYQAVLPGVTSNKYISLSCRLGRALVKHYLPSRLGLQHDKVRSDSVMSRTMSVNDDNNASSRQDTKSIAEQCERTNLLTKQSKYRNALPSKASNKLSGNSSVPQSTPSKALKKTCRPTIRDEQLLREGFEVKAASFQKRAVNDLRNLVEDQWIKELHASLDAEMNANHDSLSQKTSTFP